MSDQTVPADDDGPLTEADFARLREAVASCRGPAADTGTSVDEAVPPADGSKERLQYELRQAWAAYDEQCRELARLRARTHEIQAEEMRKRAELDSEVEKWRNMWAAAESMVSELTAEWSASPHDVPGTFWRMTSWTNRATLFRLVGELHTLRAQVAALTAEHSGTCDDLAPCQRCADRDELTGLRAMQQRAQTIATWNGQRRAGGCARHPREGVDMTGFEFRIEYTIQRRAVDGEGDFVDVGFGSSGAWDDVNAAAFAMESYIQNRQWETEGDMPDPDEVEGSA